ncbi:MAG TPA: hypothetical protein PK668_25120 [Myxococcota bacterium]|nr:hypothetical protein [Myxococcota bacterium]HRY95296.1 hypothetical protein [Myxococcota bacterium]HSA20879.1 hypothetical protein [Myxococcota bacterium]
MPGRGEAPATGKALEEQVEAVAAGLGLEVARQVRVGRRVWGAERHIDLVLCLRSTGRRLGLECKFQGTPGSAEEKIPATLRDIEAWPIDGLVVVSGEGFSEHMKAYLLSTGKVIYLEDLETWLRLYFGLDLR